MADQTSASESLRLLDDGVASSCNYILVLICFAFLFLVEAFLELNDWTSDILLNRPLHPQSCPQNNHREQEEQVDVQSSASVSQVLQQLLDKRTKLVLIIRHHYNEVAWSLVALRH